MELGVRCEGAGELLPERAALLRYVETTATRLAASSRVTVLPHGAESHHSQGRVHGASIVLRPITDIAGRHAGAGSERVETAVESSGDEADGATLN